MSRRRRHRRRRHRRRRRRWRHTLTRSWRAPARARAQPMKQEIVSSLLVARFTIKGIRRIRRCSIRRCSRRHARGRGRVMFGP